MAQPLGLIAGEGRFPLEVARALRARGERVVALGLHGLTDPALGASVDALHWLDLGQVVRGLDALAEAGVREAVMAGKVPKALLFARAGGAHLDALARGALDALPDRADDTLLGAVAAVLAARGIALHGQAAFTPELLVEEGVLGARAPTDDARAAVAFGLPVARALAGLDVGQSVLVKQRAVIAVEAIEGTDAAIARAGALAGPGCALVKVAKPRQDARFDVPVIGPGTVEALAGAGARALAIESGSAVLLD
ncbi:MAG: UDP-2,3-diacylglucosamine diphosphatase LpxI, partial [Myxococcales bacterium]|nr:UDP-2,3-diacylglucosamine diphosphatase LpxI [Myxococcales bacterium]